MKESLVKDLTDFANLCIKNPYRADTRLKTKLMARKLLKIYETRDHIIQSLIGLGQDFARHRIASTHQNGSLQDHDELVWQMENEVAVVLLGALRFAGALEMDSRHYDAGKYAQLIAPEILDVVTVRKWNPLGVIAAAKRCETHLENKLKGTSPELTKARAAVWSAAFGDNLSTAMRYGHILRKQNVLIYGDSGSGKEEAAKAILDGTFQETGTDVRHCHSINVAAIQPNLIESELFGHIKGAFTGANTGKTGAIQAADTGILFLDEIGELPRYLQSKFLRVMETGRVQRVGDNREIPVDVRYIAATHRNLEQMVGQNRFRLDFFYRLYGSSVIMPRLSDFIDQDLPDLIEKFMPLENQTELGTVTEFLRSTYQDYQWPGNVRELRNVIFDYVLRGSDQTTPRPEFGTGDGTTAQRIDRNDIPQAIMDVSWTESELLSWYRRRALDKHKSRASAAGAIGVSIRTLERFCKADGGN